MLGKEEWRKRFLLRLRTNCGELLLEQLFQEHLLLDPERHCHHVRSDSSRGKRKLRFQYPIKSQQRLVVEDNILELLERCVSLLKAEPHGVTRKPCIVFLTAESLFLRGGYDLPIA